MTHNPSIKALGEIALRVKDLNVMQAFYENVVGLELMKRFDNEIAFFRIAAGYGGHTQILALFDRGTQKDYVAPDAPHTSVDHFAFTIALDDFERERQRLESLAVKVTTTTHAWVHWRSLYFFDPEGNEVEFVCYDPSA